MKIYTNNHWRPLLSLADIPEKAQKEFDYIGEEDSFSPRIVKYKGEYYDLGDFITTSPGPWNNGLPKEFLKFDGYASGSYFSGVLCKYSEDFEEVIMATYIS